VSFGRRIWNWFLGCHHRELSRAFTNEGQTYKVCLKCGMRFPYSLETMKIVPERPAPKTQRR
jgi:hypothetical protein